MNVEPISFCNDPATPSTFIESQIVSGRIDPDSATNTVHYWNIDVQAGFYHVLLDSETVDDRSSNIGIEVNDRDSGSRILSGNEIDHRIRKHAFIEIEDDQTIRMQIEPNFSAEDYLLAVFPIGVNALVICNRQRPSTIAPIHQTALSMELS